MTEFKEVTAFLQDLNLPKIGRGVYMDKATYIELGGTEENWNALQDPHEQTGG